MREMQTIVTDVRGVCPSVRLSVCHAAQLGFTERGSFGAATGFLRCFDAVGWVV